MDHEQGGSTLITPGRPALADLAGMLARAAGESAQWAAGITADTLLEGDLGIDSLELAELDVLVRARYGSGVNLVAFLGSLDLDQIITLTAGGLVDYLRSAADPRPNGATFTVPASEPTTSGPRRT